MFRKPKIILFILLISVLSIKPGAVENENISLENLVPANIRLTNSISSGEEFSGVEKNVGRFMRKWNIAGASLAIAHEGKLVFARGFGYSDTATKALTQPYNKFRIASISKLVTASAIMKLQEEGKLTVNDQVFGVDGILNDPFFSDPVDKRAFGITVGHLLSHEAGWSQRYGDQMFMPIKIAKNMGMQLPVDTRTIVRFALNKRLHFTPGTGKSYSNLGYSILGLIIEKVSGLSYEEYCRKTILEPVGIVDMTLAGNLPVQKAPFEVTYYQPSDILLKPSIYGTGELVLPTYGGNDIEALGGAGAWLATAPDLIRLMLALDGSDSKKDILSEQSVSFMTDPKNGFAPVGWKSTALNGSWTRTGSFPGTACMMKRQSDGLAWVVLLNTSTWNGPEIYPYITNMMNKVLSNMNEMPDYDLFRNSLPIPLNISLTQLSSN